MARRPVARLRVPAGLTVHRGGRSRRIPIFGLNLRVTVPTSAGMDRISPPTAPAGVDDGAEKRRRRPATAPARRSDPHRGGPPELIGPTGSRDGYRIEKESNSTRRSTRARRHPVSRGAGGCWPLSARSRSSAESATSAVSTAGTTAAARTEAARTVAVAGWRSSRRAAATAGFSRTPAFQVGNRCVNTSFGEVGAAANNPSLLITQFPKRAQRSQALQLPGAPATWCGTGSSPPVRRRAARTVMIIRIPGLPQPGAAQCAVWAGGGPHRIAMTERANQTPAFDVCGSRSTESRGGAATVGRSGVARGRSAPGRPVTRFGHRRRRGLRAWAGGRGTRVGMGGCHLGGPALRYGGKRGRPALGWAVPRAARPSGGADAGAGRPGPVRAPFTEVPTGVPGVPGVPGPAAAPPRAPTGRERPSS